MPNIFEIMNKLLNPKQFSKMQTMFKNVIHFWKKYEHHTKQVDFSLKLLNIF